MIIQLWCAQWYMQSSFFSVFLINKNKNAYKTNNKQRENEIDMQHEMILIKGKTVCVI